MMEGYPCTYGQKAEVGGWAFLFDAIGGILFFLGFRRIMNERRNPLSSNRPSDTKVGPSV
jgi:hypothetical protein